MQNIWLFHLVFDSLYHCNTSHLLSLQIWSYTYTCVFDYFNLQHDNISRDFTKFIKVYTLFDYLVGGALVIISFLHFDIYCKFGWPRKIKMLYSISDCFPCFRRTLCKCYHYYTLDPSLQFCDALRAHFLRQFEKCVPPPQSISDRRPWRLQFWHFKCSSSKWTQLVTSGL